MWGGIQYFQELLLSYLTSLNIFIDGIYKKGNAANNVNKEISNTRTIQELVLQTFVLSVTGSWEPRQTT